MNIWTVERRLAPALVRLGASAAIAANAANAANAAVCLVVLIALSGVWRSTGAWKNTDEQRMLRVASVEGKHNA